MKGLAVAAFFGLAGYAFLATAMNGGQSCSTPGTPCQQGKLGDQCVVLQGAAWYPSMCGRPLPDTARAGADPSVSVCGTAGMEAVLATIRTLESNGRYSIGQNGGGASGAYQFIDSTWGGYGGYRSAYQAPAGVQDAKATEDVNLWLGRGGVEAVPVGWYIGHVPPPGSPEWNTVPAPWAGNRLTPTQYRDRWMTIYRAAGAPCAA